jgi:carbon-monoxide dehydrogenase large subunit
MAHARLLGIDVHKARELPGVCAVLTFADLRSVLAHERIPQAIASAMIKFHVDPPWLARDEVCYVGEPLALVVADSRRVAEDAARLVEPDLEPLTAVVDPRAGLAPGSPRARLDCPDNLVAHTVVRYGELDAAFAGAARRISERFRLYKGGGHSIEPRGVVARFDAAEQRLTVWDSTQMPHRAKAILVEALGLGEHQVRVVAPDVGGGFGPKAVIHPEEITVPAAAMLLGRPIKWIEDRFESFIATVLERLQYWDVEVAFSAEGRLLALRGHLYHDHGACTPYGVALPYNAVTNLIGPYVLPAFEMEISLCLTNIVPTSATRGAGRPQGLRHGRLLDRIAERIGVGRDEVRRRNLIDRAHAHTVPIVQRDGAVMSYDSGDWPECQRRCRAAGWIFRRARPRRCSGRWIGIGLANYVEATDAGPSRRIGASGPARSSPRPARQRRAGHESMIAQLVAAQLGVRPEQIHVVDGDTDASPLGLGSFASRQAVTAGNAAHLAALAVADKAKRAAATILEVAPEDLELVDGWVRVKGVPELKRSLGELATALCGVPGFALPGGLPPGLAAAVDYEPAGSPTPTARMGETEVDIETGRVRCCYVVMHDCGAESTR